MNARSQTHRNVVRKEQTLREAARLGKEFGEWFQGRKKADRHRQYHTQLEVLRAVVESALGRLEAEIRAVNIALDSGSVYQECRKHDRRAVWLRKIWRFFGEKFDQRDDPTMGSVLAAADEIVWSCHAEAFRNAAFFAPGIKQAPAPLPYFDDFYSPRAIPRDDPPRGLGSQIDAQFSKAFFARLPIPLIGLPPFAIDAPWLLIYLGHETGHHVQYDLVDNWGLISEFAELVGEAAWNRPAPSGDEKEAAKWSRWSKEIFADVFSVCAMGPWAIWAIMELETQNVQEMARSKTLYPAPAVRLALMALAARELGISHVRASDALDFYRFFEAFPFDPPENEIQKTALADFRLAGPVAEAVVGKKLCGIATLKELCGFRAEDFNEFGTVWLWREALLGKSSMSSARYLRTPRLIVSAAMSAWFEVSATEDAREREEKRLALGEKTRHLIKENREEGVRAAPDALDRAEAEKFGSELADYLMGIDDDKLLA